MSKYIIELDDHIKLVTSVGVTENGVVYATSDYVYYLEELNSDYINEHFSDLQDTAYQKGFEDGKNSIDKGCEGCRYILKFANDDPCKNCSNCYTSKYAPMPKQDDSIKVGDEVTHKSDSVVWTAVCIRIDGDGRHMNLMGHTGAVGYYPVDDFKKTGRHFDIQSILEAMRTHD